MRALQTFSNLYLYQGVVDFRKSISGLATLVEQQLSLSPFAEALFIFVSRDRRKVKLLYWDKSGFALWYKVLEEERFMLPRKRSENSLILSAKELELLLEGCDIFKIKPHKTLQYNRIS